MKNPYATPNQPSAELRALIEGFRRPDYTVAAMEADSFTHVQGECAGCGSIVLYPFRLLRLRKLVDAATTLAAISATYRCTNCGTKQNVGGLLQPSYQYMGTAADTDPRSPVNKLLASLHSARP